MTRENSRRDILKGLGSIPLLAQAAVAQSGPPQSSQPSAPPLLISSQNLQWATIAEAVDATAESGYDGIVWCARNGAHIIPDNVEKDLPKAVELTRKAGMVAPFVTLSAFDSKSPRLDVVLATMKDLGITGYRTPAQPWDLTKDLPPQIEVFKARIASLAEVNGRYGATANYHVHSYPGLMGGAVWDLWIMIKDMDPRYVAVHYDLGHASVRGGDWVISAHLLGKKWMQSISLHDFQWVHFPSRQFPGPWSPKWCVPGEGVVDTIGFFKFLKGIDYKGPLEFIMEYDLYTGRNNKPYNVLGEDNPAGNAYGKWKLEIPKEQFVGAMKRDVNYYKGLMREAHLIQS
jgi:L-ribulose-5-phosphate 3-epimerase